MLKKPTYQSHSNAALDQILGQLEAVASQPFEDAHPIPAAVNHSQAFYHHERQSVFLQEWIFVCRTDEIAEPGDFLTHEIAEVPILVVRQADGGICAFVNACAHRFACLTKEDKGTTKRFTCPYHAWTYDLTGQLVRAPYMEMKEGFDRSDKGLRLLHCEIWEGFVYVSLADKPAKSLAKVLQPFRDNVVGRYDMARYQTVMRSTMSWNANWKNLIENFTESYHVPIAHKKTFAMHKKPLDVYVCGEDSDHYGYHRAPQPSETGDGAAHPSNTLLEGEWRRMMIDFCIFPCHLVTLMPDFLWYISVQPDGVGRFKATWGVSIPPEVLDDIPESKFDDWLRKMSDYMDVANDEDKILVEALHSGTKSPILPDGTLHPIERNLWQFTRYLNRVCQLG